jgi:rare lipoprotein A
MGNHRLISITLLTLMSNIPVSTVVHASSLNQAPSESLATDHTPTLDAPVRSMTAEPDTAVATSALVRNPATLPPQGSAPKSPADLVPASSFVQFELKPAQVDFERTTSSSLTPAQHPATALPQTHSTPAVDLTATLKVGQPQQPKATAELPPATLYAYRMDGKEVSTVYLRDLPVISFVEHPDMEEPLLRASALVAQLNQLAQGYAGNQTITLDWVDPNPGKTPETQASADSTLQLPLHYAIKVNQQELLRVNEGVLLVGNEDELVDAALLATNRLRRLLLDAPPIQPPALPEQLRQESVTAFNPNWTPVLGKEQEGYASWYSLHKTRHQLTAAHRTLPFGTQVRVTNLDNGRTAVVKINDRGPFIPGRVIDVSVAAAQALGMIQAGVARVRVEVVAPTPN